MISLLNFLAIFGIAIFLFEISKIMEYILSIKTTACYMISAKIAVFTL